MILSKLLLLGPEYMANFSPSRLLPGAEILASYADALWVRHAIFLPLERLLRPTAHSLPFVCAFPIKATEFRSREVCKRLQLIPT